MRSPLRPGRGGNRPGAVDRSPCALAPGRPTRRRDGRATSDRRTGGRLAHHRLAYSGYLNLLRSKPVGDIQFTGLAKYAIALKGPELRAGLGRMALFLVVRVPLMLGLSLFVALALDRG